MPTFTMTKTYLAGNVLTESQLDDMKNSTETFLNTTQLDDDNIQTGGVGADSLATNSVITVKIAANAVTATKVDETDDYEMNSLQFGSATGPKFVQEGTTDRVILEGLLRFGEANGPLLQRNDATTRLLIGASLRIGSATGPILSEDSGALQIGGNLDIDGTTITLDDDGTTVKLVSTAAKGIAIDDGAGLQTVVTADLTSAPMVIYTGRSSATTDGSGDFELAIVFANTFKSPIVPTVTITDFGANSTGGGFNQIKTATLSATGFTWKVSALANTLYEMNWIAIGDRDS